MNAYVQQLEAHMLYALDIISRVEGHRWKGQFLQGLGLNGAKIVDFGCDLGYESVALAWYLEAAEVVGVDIAQSDIEQARTACTNLHDQIGHISSTLSYIPQIPANLRAQAHSLLGQYSHRTIPTFLVADITQRTELPPDYFDLAFCERLLYHIACDDAKSGMRNTLSAVQEMVRVTAPGGIIVAIERTTCSLDDDTPVRLDHHFRRVGLTRLETAEPSFSRKKAEDAPACGRG